MSQQVGSMTSGLEGKRALVTGGHRGIGRAIAKAFVSAGARVAIADVEQAEDAAREIGGDTLGLACDVRSSDEVEAAVRRTTATFGGLDVLVNNAGVEVQSPLHDHTEEQFDRLFSVNVRGTWLCYKHALPALLDGGGSIVNVSSIAGLVGFAQFGIYAATKAAVARMTEAMALEQRDAGIRANAICPGFIDTSQVHRGTSTFEDIAGTSFDDVIAKRQGRIGRPEEVAAVAVFLASDAASLITGATVNVDGALNLQRI